MYARTQAQACTQSRTQAHTQAHTQAQGLKIALGCQARVGKDTFADILCTHKDMVRVSFAEAIYDICSHTQQVLGLPVAKDRKLMQTTGDMLRQLYGQDVFVDLLFKKINNACASGASNGNTNANANANASNGNIVVTDVRFPNEFDMLREAGFVLIKIVRFGIDSAMNSQMSPSEASLCVGHASETSLINHDFDIVIVNPGVTGMPWQCIHGNDKYRKLFGYFQFMFNSTQ